MFELKNQIDTSKLEDWCNQNLLNSLSPDVSNYAKGRKRIWLNIEPMLFSPFNTIPAFLVSQVSLDRLSQIIEWQFDYCLITYSEEGKGITLHRDAGYANYEAYGLNISGTCKFTYQNSRKSFDSYGPLGPVTEETYNLQPGDVYHFNCKNLHSASPSSDRWAANFWKRK